MKRILIILPVILLGLTAVFLSNNSNAASHPFFLQDSPPAVDIFGVSLRDGDLIGASTFGDPDIYIVNFQGFNEAGSDGIFRVYHGAKRLFLNPTIFSFYGHLGGFANVRPVHPNVLDSFQTSGLFRNCETDDQRVWAVEVTGEDSGIFHHVQISGAAAILEDPNFFKKVFCINSNEERWYAKSIFPYTRLADVPRYTRSIPTPGCFYEVQCIGGLGAPCQNVLVCPTITPAPGPCYRGGCSEQICSDNPNAISTCEFRPEYACYRTATCERQTDGQCGWTQTSDLLACLAPIPTIRAFTITADDSSFETSSPLSVLQGDLVRLTFNVRTTNVAFGGLDFRSNVVNTGTILPGGSKTVEFTADGTVTFRSFWPGSGVMKPYTIIIEVAVE